MEQKIFNEEEVKEQIRKEHNFPTKRYECQTCGSLINIKLSDDINSMRCPCKKSDWKLIYTEEPTDEQIIEAKEKLNELYYKIIDILKEYVDLREDYYKFLAVWIIATYFQESFTTFPIIFLNSIHGGGKTRLEKLISALGAKGDGSVLNSVTEAVLFRTPQGTTTCIDEIEHIGDKSKQVLRELLNAVYKKGTKVKRMKKVKEKNEELQKAETFEPFFPLVIANIWGLDEVLQDRAITLILEKSNNPKFVRKIEDFSTNAKIIDVKRTFEEIQCRLCRVVTPKNIYTFWNRYIDTKYTNDTNNTNDTNDTNNNNDIYIYNNNDITTTTTINNEELFNKIDSLEIWGRNLELMFPLILTSKGIGDEVFIEFLSIAKKIVKEKTDDEYTDSIDVKIYDFVSSLESPILKVEFFLLSELVLKFKNFIGQNEDWINEKWFGRAIKRCNLILEKKRVAQGRKIRLDIEKAKEKLKMFKPIEKNENSDDK